MKKLIKIIAFHPIRTPRLYAMMIVILTLLLPEARSAERDPFLPYMASPPTSASDSGGNVKPGAIVNPLVDKPIAAYTVIGVVVSPTDALAVFKSRDKHEYFAYIGDPVGSEGGKIETINTEGITLNINGRIVPLKVSNRFEMQDEKQTDEKK